MIENANDLFEDVKDLFEKKKLLEKKTTENIRELLEAYILNLYEELRDSIYYNNGKENEIQIKIDTAIELASNFGIKISKDEEIIVLPYIYIDWDSNLSN